MADLVISGMEMPTVCIDNGWYGNCPMDRSWCAQRFAPKDSTNGSTHKDQWNKLPSWCPLFPIPKGHGRLIDADAVAKEAYRSLLECEKYGNEFQKPYEIIRAIETAKTIVPAEGGTEDG